MKIATFNANGVRARLPIIAKWLQEESPDVLCLQETKVQDADFPRQPFKDLGYHCSFRGEKSYNGVAMLSKAPPEGISFGFSDERAGEETRLMAARITGIPIVNTYVPQGYAPESEKFQYKLRWLERLRRCFSQHFQSDMPLLWVGDFNVAPEPIDVYDPKRLLGSVGFHPAEHKALAAIKAWGFVDVFRKHQSEGKMYSFWDYRIPNAVQRGLGWRVDHIWATACVAEKSTRAWIDIDSRCLPKPSDHTFMVAEFATG